MGILDKIKEIFGKKPIESLNLFENELIKLHERKVCDLVALSGTGGRLKGLPLVYAGSDENKLKLLSARMIETINSLNNMVNQKEIEKFVLYYENKAMIYIPIAKHICFHAVLNKGNEMITLQKWLNKNIAKIKELFDEKS